MHGRGPIGVYVNKIELCVKEKRLQLLCKAHKSHVMRRPRGPFLRTKVRQVMRRERTERVVLTWMCREQMARGVQWVLMQAAAVR